MKMDLTNSSKRWAIYNISVWNVNIQKELKTCKYGQMAVLIEEPEELWFAKKRFITSMNCFD